MVPTTSSFARFLAPAAARIAGAPRRGAIARAIDAFKAARQRQAERDIARLMTSHRRGLTDDVTHRLDRRFRIDSW